MLNLSPQNRISDPDPTRSFQTFKVLRPAGASRRVARTLQVLGMITISFMFVPWQQNIRGNGKVTSFLPEDRPQTVNSIIPGKIEHWYVQEGQFVRKGDSLLRISEVKDKYMDPNTTFRTQEQVLSKEQSVLSYQTKIQALDAQIAALESGRILSIQKGKNKVLQTRNKVLADSADVVAASVAFDVAKEQFARMEELYTQGLRSLTDYEGRKLKFQETQSKLQSIENKLAATRQEYTNAIIELSSIEADYQDKISKSQSEKSSALAALADATASLSKLKNDLQNVTIRSNYYVIRAPQDGYVVKTLKQGIGEILGEGDAVATIMPSDPTLAVELFVNANDVPLIAIGTKVRLQFDGWPALQFSGWPNVAVGTFGGEIRVIDYINSPEGKYRVLVVQDPAEEPWPAQLRVGSGVYGWAMLNTVAIYFELWRQVNGFPPSLYKEPEMQDPAKQKEDKKKSKDKEGNE